MHVKYHFAYVRFHKKTFALTIDLFSALGTYRRYDTFVFAGTADAKAIVPPSKLKRKPELWSSRHLDEYDTYYI